MPIVNPLRVCNIFVETYTSKSVMHSTIPIDTYRNPFILKILVQTSDKNFTHPLVFVPIDNVSLINHFGCVRSRHFRIREARIVAQTFSL